MARPQRERRICALPRHTLFLPCEDGETEAVELSLDEYEAIRLMDREGCTHEQCAQVMQVSRTTVTEIYASARHRDLNARLIRRRGKVKDHRIAVNGDIHIRYIPRIQ